MFPDCRNINEALTSYIIERQLIKNNEKIDMTVISAALASKLKIDAEVHFITKSELIELIKNQNQTQEQSVQQFTTVS